MTIVHINTDLRLAWRHGLEGALHEIAPYKILPAVVWSVSEVVERRLRLFNFR